MIIHVSDIPSTGRTLEFSLEAQRLNALAAEAERNSRGSTVPMPNYTFTQAPAVELQLQIEGLTIVVSGHAQGQVSTTCSRCAEEALFNLNVPVSLILKPISARAQVGEQDEDLSMGFYNGEQVDCAELVQDFVMLALPFSVVCNENCRGLCQRCGTNLNTDSCACSAEAPQEGPLALIKQLLH